MGPVLILERHIGLCLSFLLGFGFGLPVVKHLVQFKDFLFKFHHSLKILVSAWLNYWKFNLFNLVSKLVFLLLAVR